MRSAPEIWPHVKIDDGCVFWTHFALLDNYLFDLFWGLYLTWPPRVPKGSPKGPKRYPKTPPKDPQISPRVPKDLAKGAQRLARRLQTSQRLPQRHPKASQSYKKVSKGLPKSPQDQAGGENLRWGILEEGPPEVPREVILKGIRGEYLRWVS